jgi:hypothetical protein
MGYVVVGVSKGDMIFQSVCESAFNVLYNSLKHVMPFKIEIKMSLPPHCSDAIQSIFFFGTLTVVQQGGGWKSSKILHVVLK